MLVVYIFQALETAGYVKTVIVSFVFKIQTCLLFNSFNLQWAKSALEKSVCKYIILVCGHWTSSCGTPQTVAAKLEAHGVLGCLCTL